MSSPEGESVVAKRLYQNCPISLHNKDSYVCRVELDMLDFYVILCMDCLHACFASIDCRTRVMRFNFPKKTVVEWKGENSIPRGRIISCLKACKMISKGCLYHIVRVQDLDSDIPPINSIPIVSEFQKVFPNEIPSIPPEW